MRPAWKILVLLAVLALAIFAARRWYGTPSEQGQEATKSSMSPEETKRLVEQALGQPRETVRFQLDPSASDDQGAAALPPPSLAPANPAPPPPTLAGPAKPTAEPVPTVGEQHRDNAVRALSQAFTRMGKLAKAPVPTAPGAPSGTTPAPASPTPAAPAVPAPAIPAPAIPSTP